VFEKGGVGEGVCMHAQTNQLPTHPPTNPQKHNTAPVVIKCPGCCHLWCFACACPPHFALPCAFAKQWGERTADEDGMCACLYICMCVCVYVCVCVCDTDRTRHKATYVPTN
jgi:hypothetical protein